MTVFWGVSAFLCRSHRLGLLHGSRVPATTTGRRPTSPSPHVSFPSPQPTSPTGRTAAAHPSPLSPQFLPRRSGGAACPDHARPSAPSVLWPSPPPAARSPPRWHELYDILRHRAVAVRVGELLQLRQALARVAVEEFPLLCRAHLRGRGGSPHARRRRWGVFPPHAWDTRANEAPSTEGRPREPRAFSNSLMSWMCCSFCFLIFFAAG